MEADIFPKVNKNQIDIFPIKYNITLHTSNSNRKTLN